MNRIEATQYIKATLTAFGPDEAISMTKETWAKLHEAMKALATQPAQPQQEPVAYMNPQDMEKMKRFGRGSVAWATPTDFCTQPVYTSPPAQRKPLTHEQRVDLLSKFEAHKHEWHAPAILIDMVETAHGITGEKK